MLNRVGVERATCFLSQKIKICQTRNAFAASVRLCLTIAFNVLPTCRLSKVVSSMIACPIIFCFSGRRPADVHNFKVRNIRLMNPGEAPEHRTPKLEQRLPKHGISSTRNRQANNFKATPHLCLLPCGLSTRFSKRPSA